MTIIVIGFHLVVRIATGEPTAHYFPDGGFAVVGLSLGAIAWDAGLFWSLRGRPPSQAPRGKKR